MRSSRLRLGGAVLAGIVWAGVSAASAGADGLGLVVSTTPNGPAESKIAVAVKPGASQATAYVYVRQENGAAVEGLRLVGASDGATVDVAPDGGTAGAETTLTAGGLLRYAVTVSAVAATRATGDLTALAGGKAQQLATLTITRPPGAVLAIAGAGDSGITRTTDVAQLDLPLLIVSNGPDKVDDLHVDVAPFAGDAGQTAAATVVVGGRPSTEATVHAVSGNGVLPLDISADLEAGGTYTSAIRLIYGGTSATIPLTVTRALAAPTIAFEAVPDVMHTVGWCGSSHSVSFRVPANETGGRTVQLGRPTLVLKRSDGTASFQAAYASFSIDGKESGFTTFAPGESRTLKVTISGLRGCGQFATILHFRGAGPDTKDVSTTLWVRVSWWWPFLLLLLAVGLGEAVRIVRSNYLVGLAAGADLAQLNDQLERALKAIDATPEEQALLQPLRDQLADLYQTVIRKPTTDVTARRTALETKLHLVGRWLAARHNAAAAGWPGDSGSQLLTVQNFLRSASDTDGGPSQTALEHVEALLGNGPDLTRAIDELDRAARQWAAQSNVTPEEKNAVNDAIADARTKLQSGALPEAEAAYDTAAHRFAQTAADELASLAQGQAPAGVKAADWSALGAELAKAASDVTSAPDARTAVEEYQAGLARYLQVVAAGLQREVASKAGAAAVLEHGNRLPQGTATAADFVPAREALQNAVDAAGASDVMRARADYDRARVALDTLRTDGLLGDADVPAVAAPPAASIPARGTSLAAPVLLIPPAAGLRRRAGLASAFVTTVAVGAAAASGLLFLYFPNAAWGNWQDVVIMFLWGLGVHAVANATYQSVPTVASAIGVGAGSG